MESHKSNSKEVVVCICCVLFKKEILKESSNGCKAISFPMTNENKDSEFNWFGRAVESIIEHLYPRKFNQKIRWARKDVLNFLWEIDVVFENWLACRNNLLIWSRF